VSTPQPAAAPAAAGSSSTGLITFLVASIAVIALAYIASRFLGNWQALQTRGRKLRVLEGVAIGKDRNLVLVAVGKEILVLGSAPGGVNLVHKIDDPELVRELLTQPAPGPDLPRSMTDVEASIRASLAKMRSLVNKSGRRPDA